MIIMINGECKIEGKGYEVVADTAIVLRQVYKTLKNNGGKQFADKNLAMIGRLAVAESEDIGSVITEMMDEIVKGDSK